MFFFFFFKQKTAYEISACLVGSAVRNAAGAYTVDAQAKIESLNLGEFTGNSQSGAMSYTIGNKEYEVSGEFYYNKAKDRIEHVHEGPKGGQYLIIW